MKYEEYKERASKWETMNDEEKGKLLLDMMNVTEDQLYGFLGRMKIEEWEEQIESGEREHVWCAHLDCAWSGQGECMNVDVTEGKELDDSCSWYTPLGGSNDE